MSWNTAISLGSLLTVIGGGATISIVAIFASDRAAVTTGLIVGAMCTVLLMLKGQLNGNDIQKVHDLTNSRLTESLDKISELERKIGELSRKVT